MLDKSRFCRRLHRLKDLIFYLFHKMGQHLKDVAGASNYQMDSFPVIVCENARISRCRIIKHKAFRGKHSTHGRYFYGVRVHILTLQGIPVEFCLLPGSENDTNALYKLPLQVAPESCIYLDAGYNDYRAEDNCFEAEGVYLKVQRKSNSRRKDTASEAFVKSRMRKNVETSISLITAHFPAHIHAVTKDGFLIKVPLFVISYAFEQFVS
jgi:DDE family transposase